jgi:GMP synthase (glutamine-hydrolysing)
MGGTVGYHPGGPEIGTVTICLTDDGKEDPLLAGLPDRFPAHVSHSQTALSLPRGTRLLAASGFEPHHAIRIGKCAWGVQFHPEFPSRVMEAYIMEQAPVLEQHGTTASLLVKDVRDTPESHGVLQRFGRIALDRRS